MIPIIDIFAGPGGLGEGFSALATPEGRRIFKIALSVEMEENARETLKLRSFFRQFSRTDAPVEYYQCLEGNLKICELYALRKFRVESSAAEREAMCAELGADDERINEAIAAALKRHKIELKCPPRHRPHWALIGGPPCQAYSLVGRSRMRSTDPAKYAADPRHKLYLHYLRIIAEYEPAVFVMENVKGILSSRLDGERIFARILHDLEKPGASIGSPRGRECSEYDIHPCVDYGDQTLLFRGKDRIDIRRPDDYIVRCERHDIPQRRHRVILIGIRRDVNRKPDPLNYCAEEREFATVRSAIGDLPKLRSDLSSMNGWKSWPDAIREAVRRDVVRGTASEVLNEMHKYVERLGSNLSTGSDHCEKGLGKPSEWLRRWSDWFIDERLENVCNHSTRTHIGEDLQRYFFAACFSRACRRSPKISEFPSVLWPKHRNITEEEPEDFIFEDRFRVQLRDAPATTVTSHISKDGHYFIHYDPAQCRSLTVREAARLQTFPDNYFFAGPRTSQYHQVGNAVPPLLAHQIARQVQQILSGAGKSSSGR